MSGGRTSRWTRVNNVLVHLKECHLPLVVVVLVQQDHELDEVRARLLPKGLFAPAKEIGHELAMP